MAKRHERNTKVTANSVELSRNDVINDIKTWLREATDGISGNAQRNISEAVILLIGNDKKNEDWASVEADVYEAAWNKLAELWQDSEGVFTGLSSKAFGLISEHFDNNIINHLAKTNKDLEILEYIPVNSYTVKVACSMKGKAFWVLLKSVTGKASGLAILPAKLLVSKANDSSTLRSAFSDIKQALELVTIS